MTPQEHVLLEDLFGQGVAEHSEGGISLIVLPVVTMPTGCRPLTVMGIYVPQGFQGYATRLFLESPILLASGAQPATTVAVLLGRTMHAASIKDVSAQLPLHYGILAHLRRYEASS